MDKEFYIFGMPVETSLCEVRFLKYYEYVQNLPELSLISLNIIHIFYQYKEANKMKDPEIDEALESLKKESLFNFVDSQDNFKKAYRKIFKLVIDEDNVIDAIMSDEELFMEYRSLIMDMQILTETETSPNEEIMKAMERSRRVKQANAEKQSYSDIISSIVAGTSNSFDDVLNMTVLQAHVIYYRLGAIFSYQTSSLFATVAEKVQIEAWNKHIDLWATESDTIERSDFNKKFGSMF